MKLRTLAAAATHAALYVFLPSALAAAGTCPQPRETAPAPPPYSTLRNPLLPGTYDRSAAERLYFGTTGSGAGCVACHGPHGDGGGQLANQFDPAPRNFTCRQTLGDVPDGQLFWVIRYGSPRSAMPPHPGLTDTQIWLLVRYVRQFSGDY